MVGKRILLIIGGGIAAYKTCELIRLFRRADMPVRCVLTEAGAKFVTPMTLAALSEQPVCDTLWDLERESKIGHIALSREADLVVVAPATADLMAKMAHGFASDLATTLLLATDKPVLVAPAMNVRMWQHAATRRNVAQLRNDGVTVMEPDEGTMACGEYGPGRLPHVDAIFAAAVERLARGLSTPALPRAKTRGLFERSRERRTCGQTPRLRSVVPLVFARGRANDSPSPPHHRYRRPHA